MYNILIVGAGTWGIAVASLLARNGHNVEVFLRSGIQLEKLEKTRRHEKLPGLILSENISFTNILDEAVVGKDVIIFAVPSIAFRDVARDIVKRSTGKEYFVSLTKGMEEKTLYTMSDIIEDELIKAKKKSKKVAALSGPTHAEEVALKMPTFAVATSKSIKVAKFVQDIFMNKDYFRVYTNTDIKGVEVCAAFKNVIALASGVLAGLGYGDNIKAAVITRGLAEMVRAGKALGCRKDTFYGLAGVGDMIVTATSMNSRNYRCGKLIGEGYDADKAIKKIGMVVEGVNFIPKAIKIEKKYKIELPITNAMKEVIFDKKDPRKVFNLLMLRRKKSE